MTARMRRPQALFHWRASDGLAAWAGGREVAPTYTRTAPKTLTGANGVLVPAVRGTPATTILGGQVAHLTEPEGRNLCPRSEELDLWTNLDGCAVAANARRAADTSATADRLTATATTSARRSPQFEWTADGVRPFFVHLAAGTSARSALRVWDGADPTWNAGTGDRRYLRVTWTNGVPSVTSVSGAGDIRQVVPLGDGWYRIGWTASVAVEGLIEFESTLFPTVRPYHIDVIPDDLNGEGTVYAWGAQAEEAAQSSSYIRTGAAGVTRAADALYWPGMGRPQPMTVYLRCIDLGISEVVQGRYLAIGDIPASGSWFRFQRNGTDLQLSYANGTNGTGPSLAGIPAYGDLVEFRGVLRPDGSVYFSRRINGGAEATSAVSTAIGIPPEWSAPRLWLSGATAAQGAAANTHCTVLAGEHSMDAMRVAAGVV